jgi:hypothetical protein
MTDSTLTASRGTVNLAGMAQGIPGFVRGARWFWWIAGFSAVNAVLNLSHSDTNFVVGLAFTLLAHAAFPTGIALVIDALLVGGFFLVGLMAQRGQAWAFILGIVVYVCDALVYMKVGDWLPVGIHGLALYYIVTAFLGLRAAKKTAGL